MKRKVVAQGPSSMIISLPSDWIKKNNIKKGDDLEVEEINNHLEISSKPIMHQQAITIDVTGLNRTSILLYLLSVYRRGYTEINIQFNTPTSQHYKSGNPVPVVAVIQDVISRFIGVEIVRHTKDYIQIKQISEDSEKDFDLLLKRVVFLVIDSFKTLELGLKEDDEEMIDATMSHYLTTRKFINYCIRLIHEGAVPEIPKSLSLMTLLSGMDRIIKSMKQFGTEKLLRKVKAPRKVLPIMEELTKSMELFQKFYLSRDVKILDELELKRQFIKKNLRTVDLNGDEMIISDFIKISVESIQDMLEATLRL